MQRASRVASFQQQYNDDKSTKSVLVELFRSLLILRERARSHTHAQSSQAVDVHAQRGC